MQNKLKMLAALSLISVLAACGGGNNDGGGAAPPPPRTADIQGGYVAASNGGSSGSALILEDGTVWAIGGTGSGGSFVAETLLRGPTSVSGSAVSSSSLREYEIATATTITGVGFAGSVAGSGVITGTLTYPDSSTITTTLTPSDPAVYDYGTPATLAAIAGSWTGFFTTGDSGTLDISSGGVVTSVTNAGCTITGTVAPRASGKNVYNVTVNFGPAPCLFPGGTGSGVVTITSSGSARQLLVGIVIAGSSFDAGFVGTEQAP